MNPRPRLQAPPRRRRNAWWTRWPIALWLAVMWMLLWGDVNPANFLSGIVIAFGILWLLPMPKVGFDGRIWLPGLVRLLGLFVWDTLKASAQITWYAVSPKRTPHGAIVRVQLHSHSDVLLTITAQFTSLVPGSVVVEAQRLTGIVYVHVFDAEISGGIEAARATVVEQERRIMYAIASDAEIEAAGYPPRGWVRIKPAPRPADTDASDTADREAS